MIIVFRDVKINFHGVIIYFQGLSLISATVNPAVGAYLEAEKDSLAAFLVTTIIVCVAEVVHLATWSAYHRAVAAALKTLFPNPSPSMGKGFSPLKGGVRGGLLSFKNRILLVLLPRALEGMAAGDANGIVTVRGTTIADAVEDVPPFSLAEDALSLHSLPFVIAK